jgi:hypothetical protein
MRYLVDPAETAKHPIVANIRNAYRKNSTVSTGSVILTDSKCGNNGPSIILNTIIDDNPNPKYLGALVKYILCLRFLDAGKSASLDLVRLEASQHKYIVWHHATKMDIWPEGINPHIETDMKLYVIPFLIAGGKIHKDRYSGIFSFDNGSSSFGQTLLGHDVHALAREIHFRCFGKGAGDLGGETALRELLTFMAENHGNGFYDKLAGRYPIGKAVHVRSLGAMKALNESISAG